MSIHSGRRAVWKPAFGEGKWQDICAENDPHVLWGRIPMQGKLMDCSVRATLRSRQALMAAITLVGYETQYSDALL